MTCLKTVGRYLLLHLPLYPAAEGRQELELLNGFIPSLKLQANSASWRFDYIHNIMGSVYFVDIDIRIKIHPDSEYSGFYFGRIQILSTIYSKNLISISTKDTLLEFWKVLFTKVTILIESVLLST